MDINMEQSPVENLNNSLAQISNQLSALLANQNADNITDYNTLVPYQELTYTIAAGARQEVYQVFNYFRVTSQSGGALSVRFGQNGLETPFTGQGIGVQFSVTFPRLTLVNTGGTSMTITIAIAVGRISDDRLNVSGTVTVAGTVTTNDNPGTTIVNGQVTINNTATQIVAANATRRHVIIKNPSTATKSIFVGDSGVTTTNGIEVAIGESITIDSEAALYAIVATGSQAGVGYLEMRD